MKNRHHLNQDPAARPAAHQLKAPEWKVFFDGNFWGHSGKDHAGKEIIIGKQFRWADRHWLIPAAYACSRGLVVDFCMRAEAEEIRSFMRKWHLGRGKDDSDDFTPEQQMEIEADNPLCLDYNPQLELNGRQMRTSHGCAVTFNPCQPVNELEAAWVVSHYGLDTASGWVIWRYAFPWAVRRRPEITTLSLTMVQGPVPVPGPRFRVRAPGDTVAFTWPEDGRTYTLTVQKMTQQIMPEGKFGSDPGFDRWEYPSHYCTMSYTVTPEMPEGVLTVTDCAKSDRPKEKNHYRSHEPTSASSVVAVAVIGGADGPTTLIFGPQKQGKVSVVCSALHFSPVSDIEWRMVFHEKRAGNVTTDLIRKKEQTDSLTE